MSDVSPGAGAPGASAGIDVPAGYPTDPSYTTNPSYSTNPSYTNDPSAGGSTSGDASTGERAKVVAEQGKQAAGDVKDTAKEQVQRVAEETKAQARGLASDVRDRVGEQARTQNDKLVGSIRQTADQLDEMRGDRADSPAAAVVSRIADGGRQFADYLDKHGPEGVLNEVQDFARRRPGAFLATALAAGFVVGRLGKSVAKAAEPETKPASDAYVSPDPVLSSEPAPGGYDTGYSTGTGYNTGTTVSTEYAATGTGAPVVVAEDYVGELPPVDRPGGVR